MFKTKPKKEQYEVFTKSDAMRLESQYSLAYRTQIHKIAEELVRRDRRPSITTTDIKEAVKLHKEDTGSLI